MKPPCYSIYDSPVANICFRVDQVILSISRLASFWTIVIDIYPHSIGL
jgi:hypothetical protein